MFPRKVYAPVLTALLLISALTEVQAQTEAARPRRVSTMGSEEGAKRLVNDLVVALADDPVKPRQTPFFVEPLSLRFRQLLTAEINERLGSPYVYGASGPFYFDCSGFVWAVFQGAGLEFARSSARSFWQDFESVKAGEEYKFGTLVFFNNLQHVGIVADENGFYHASRSNGVTYSPFNKYWSSRVDGFRRVPQPLVATGD